MTALQATGEWGYQDALVLALARCALTAALLRRRRHRARLQLPSRACARRLAGTEGQPCNLQSSVQALSAHALLPRSANACPAPQASADVTARAAVQPRTRPGARPEACRGRVTQQKTRLFARCSNQYGPQSHCDEGAQSVLAATQTRVNRTGRRGAGVDTRPHRARGRRSWVRPRARGTRSSCRPRLFCPSAFCLARWQQAWQHVGTCERWRDIWRGPAPARPGAPNARQLLMMRIQ